jgi:NDP-sugar pyrophosphorylase family protein
MRALILVGGFGTRLRPYTLAIPKPLLPFRGIPIVQRIIERFREAGIRDIVMATGYKAEMIRGVCGDGSKFGVQIEYVHENRPLGTAGPLSLIRHKLDSDEYVILMNGDIVTELAFEPFLNFARTRSYELTVAYATYTYQSPFGILTVSNGRVDDITEKPSYQSLVSAGIYAVKGSSVRLLAPEEQCSMPELIKTLLRRGSPVGAYQIHEFWMGLERMKDFREAIRELNRAELTSSALDHLRSGHSRSEPLGAA